MLHTKVNGKPIDSMAGVILKPNDRICIGPSNLFLFKNKQREEEASMPDPEDDPISFEFADEELLAYADAEANEERK